MGRRGPAVAATQRGREAAEGGGSPALLTVWATRPLLGRPWDRTMAPVFRKKE